MSMYFKMSVESAIKFYEICKEVKATTEEDKAIVLQEMAREGLIDNVVKTDRSKEQIIADMSKRFKTLVIKDKE